MFRISCLRLVAGLLALLPPLVGAGPMVHHIEAVTPRAGQRGTTVEVTLEGAYLKDPREVLFYRPGIRCVAVKALPSLPQPRNTVHSGFVEDLVQCRFEIAPDCPSGLHPFKLRTASELTMISTFVVSVFPVVDEAERAQGGNDTLQTAMPVALNTSVRGAMTNSALADVDLYRVAGKAGQHLSVEVDAVWISERYYGGAECDLMARILDWEGREMARNDDSALHLQDPIVSTLLSRDGDYYVEVRQRVFGGACSYVAHIGSNVRPVAAYPVGGRAGESLEVTLLGDPAGPVKQRITLPESPGDFGFQGGMPSPIPLRVSRCVNVLEDAGADVTPVPSLPAALNGIIDQPGDEDTFRVTVRKGDRWRVRVFGRSLGTPLDPRVTIRRVGGEGVEVEGDDATLEERGLYAMGGQIQRREKMDPCILWEPKADGDHLLSISDMRGLGDPLSVYRIEVEAVEDEVNTSIGARVIDGVECPRLTGIAIPQGGRWNVNVNLSEGQGNRYKGDLEIAVSGLPEGVRMIAPRIRAGAKQAQVQFIADAGAKPQVALITLGCRAADGSPLVSHSQQSFPFLNHSGGHAWHTFVVDQYALAVTETAPFALELVQPAIPLSQSSELAVQVKVTRSPGFQDAIEFQCDWLPPGVHSEPTVTIPEGRSEGILHLSADENAPAATWDLAVTASTAGGSYYLGAGRTRCATNFIQLTVATPYVALKNKPAAVRRGGAARIEWEVDHKKPITGEAEALLLGLPKGVSVSNAPKLRQGDAKLVFDVTATEEALLGQYKELACELVVREGGQEIRQRSGRGVLRVDPALGAGGAKP